MFHVIVRPPQKCNNLLNRNVQIFVSYLSQMISNFEFLHVHFTKYLRTKKSSQHPLHFVLIPHRIHIYFGDEIQEYSEGFSSHFTDNFVDVILHIYRHN